MQHGVGAGPGDQVRGARLRALIDDGQRGRAEFDPQPGEAAAVTALHQPHDRHGRVDRRAGKGAEGGQENAGGGHGLF